MEHSTTIQQRVGKEGEDLAAAYLLRKGYTILQRNYRARRGEIDIICHDNGEVGGGAPNLVFVEVKTRSNLRFDDPFDALSEEKMSSIRRAAEVFIMNNDHDDVACRFDVIGILLGPEKNEVEHIQDVMDY